ncbi:MAG TPA: SMP-30/gluconolactonase/LRE family protein [Stellaceae bacterium]|nr:SMP-30/gluconolactonase/LRE family protein [Stellaceae bacterium]
MMRKLCAGVAGVVSLLAICAVPAMAWDRGQTDIFAVLPDGSTGPEGLTVGPDGNVYVTTFGFSSTGDQPGLGQLFVFSPKGKLIRQVAVQGSEEHLLGLGFQPGVRNKVLVIDFGAGKVLNVDTRTGASTVFTTAVLPGSGLNALTFDKSGNVYVSDSFNGIVQKVGPAGGPSTIWAQDPPPTPAHPPVLTPNGFPPFGANGIEFNPAQTIMYVANTANDTIVQVPVNADGSAGTPAVLTNSINGADGIAVDRQGNIWVCANQSDEIVVIDPTGKALAKLGDFNGIDRHGVPQGLFFPASPAFSADGRSLIVSNLALDLRFAAGAQSIVSDYADEVRTYTISSIRAKIPPIKGDDY